MNRWSTRHQHAAPINRLFTNTHTCDFQFIIRISCVDGARHCSCILEKFTKPNTWCHFTWSVQVYLGWSSTWEYLGRHWWSKFNFPPPPPPPPPSSDVKERLISIIIQQAIEQHWRWIKWPALLSSMTYTICVELNSVISETGKKK